MSSKFTCRFCKAQFDVPKGLYKHLQTVHNASVSRDNRTCPICGVSCSKYEGYRDHLLYIHGQPEDGLRLTFKTLNEFLVWKTELELKHNCKYVLQTSPKVLPSKEKKYFYQCDRSNSKSNNKKSSVVMKTCSSVISVVEGTGVFKVEYWDTHCNHFEAPPIASASPNIVLTPVMPGSSLANVEPSKSTSQTQARFSTPSSVAITVSSIVKEPLYTSSVAKNMSSGSSTKNARTKTQNKFVPIAAAGLLSPDKSSNKSTTVGQGTFNLNLYKNSPNAKKAEINLASAFPKSSARKKISRSIRSISEISSYSNTNVATTNGISTGTTTVVNSQLSLTPISSTPNVTIAPQIPLHKPGTMLFESSGEIFMLEPIDNDEEHLVQNDSRTSNRHNTRPDNSETLTLYKSHPASKAIKIDRAMQTNESFSSLVAMKSKLQRKRAAPPTNDSAVMLKVKCYQLEMKYMNSQTECKRLKLELTKEKLKNAELRGDNVPENIEDEAVAQSPKINAADIMKEIEEKFNNTKDVNVYTMTKTSVLRSLYEDLEELCVENGDLYKELENYRAHDKFYQSLKKKLYDEEF